MKILQKHIKAQDTGPMYVVHPILGLRPQNLSHQVTFIKVKFTIRSFHAAIDSLAESIYISIHFFHEAMRGIFKSFNTFLDYYPTSTSLPPRESYHLWVSMIQIVYSNIKVYFSKYMLEKKTS